MSVAMAADTSARLTDAGLELVPVVESGLQLPLFLTHAGDGSGQLFVVEQGGIIRIIDRGALQNTPFLDIRDRVWRKGDEQGLLGLAFHPDPKANRRSLPIITDAKMGRQSSRSIAAKAAACRLQATPNTFSWSCRNPISTTMAG
jgi:hypothetical protein